MSLGTLKCTRCGTEFKRPTKWIAANRCRGTLPYCSKECSYAAHRTTIHYKCDECGKDSSSKPSKYGKAENHFCSKQCANTFRGRLNRGKNHPLFRTGVSSYRKRAFEFYGERCTVPGCGYCTKEVLEVHHRDGDRRNNTVENLDVMCPTHHVEYEVGIRSYQ